MKVSDFDFELPEHAIALRPAVPRESARLLHIQPDDLSGGLSDLTVGDLPSLLRAGDALVFNDTRVIAARIRGVRVRQDAADLDVECTLHRAVGPDRWTAFARPGRRLRAGDSIRFGKAMAAQVLSKGDLGEITLQFDRPAHAVIDVVEQIGEMPLPPYIASKRAQDEQDRTDYQTIYARDPGSVAAPTAGLHFTPDLMDRLSRTGVSLHYVTLHVGAGTFQPVKVEQISDHVMHHEWGQVSGSTAQALRAVRASGGRVIAVGTTALRILESAARPSGELDAFEGETDIFMSPGYCFAVVDGLVTNFHLPRSTLFMLVCALAGSARMQAAYRHAIEAGYRFYSYGDASLIWRQS